MPFTIRPHRRFPVCCPVTYHCGDSEGHGTVWNVSLTVGAFLGICRCEFWRSVFAHGESANSGDSLRGR